MTYSNYFWNVRDPERKIYKGFRFNTWLVLKLYLWITCMCDKYVNFGDKVVSWKKDSRYGGWSQRFNALLLIYDTIISLSNCL